MHHRGPDSRGTFQAQAQNGRWATLLATRLKVIDLDPRADQPIRRGDLVLAYNGELYNYLELRADLERAGESFRTTSDSEVLLATLARRGWDGLDDCEGMWAFAIFDESDTSLTLCRDRFGEKPLYVLHEDSETYFGSEIKFIETLRGRRLEVDDEQVLTYLAGGYRTIHKDLRTFFRRVREIEPGTLIRLDAHGKAVPRRYWHVAPVVDEAMTYEEAVVGVRRHLNRAVELRLRADVPLAFCLSGGVDSNALISVAKVTCGYDVHGFTIMNTDERYAERELVEAAVADLGIRHTSVPVSTADFLPDLRRLVRHHGAPVETITYYANWLLMKSIADHGYRVAVSGGGADELFTGYYDHHLMYLAEVRSCPGRYEEARAAWERHIQPLVRNPLLRDPDLFVRDASFREHLQLEAPLRGMLSDGRSERFEERSYVPGLLRNRMLNELFRETVPVVLHEEDLNAMFYSIENRSPYLDRHLFEFAFRVPVRHLVRNGFAKALLRDAVRDVAPAAVLNTRRKVGFNVPVSSFLDVNDGAIQRELLAGGPILRFVRREALAALLSSGARSDSESKFLFSVVSAKMFLEEFD